MVPPGKNKTEFEKPGGGHDARRALGDGLARKHVRLCAVPVLPITSFRLSLPSRFDRGDELLGQLTAQLPVVQLAQLVLGLA
jgi:hypothetical protein